MGDAQGIKHLDRGIVGATDCIFGWQIGTKGQVVRRVGGTADVVQADSFQVRKNRWIRVENNTIGIDRLARGICPVGLQKKPCGIFQKPAFIGIKGTGPGKIEAGCPIVRVTYVCNKKAGTREGKVSGVGARIEQSLDIHCSKRSLLDTTW